MYYLFFFNFSNFDKMPDINFKNKLSLFTKRLHDYFDRSTVHGLKYINGYKLSQIDRY